MDKNLSLEFVKELESVLKNETEFVPTEVEYLEEISLSGIGLNSSVTLEDSLLGRKSSREILEEFSYEKKDLFELIKLSMSTRKGSSDNNHFYMTPVAGGQRELKYFFIVREVEGLVNGLYEYIPESDLLCRVKIKSDDFDKLFYENWEIDSGVTLLFCFDLIQIVRQYHNNLLHCAFESGCISQILQMELSNRGKRSCISGYVNRIGFNQVLGPNSLFPMYALSMF
ncbi:MAG: hypothetical protein KC493_07195 [Bacteriovoracaceae bacterium]|nr:hypothetical protein [Bacteriovoracaceae bacterium]